MEDLPGLKNVVCLITQVENSNELFEKFSSYSRLVRVIARCLRFLRANPYKGAIEAQEFFEAEKRVIKIIQKSKLSEEFKRLRGRNNNKGGNLAALCPFIDEESLLRVGGRLERANIAFSRKHPIILPSRHHVTDLIIREIHEKLFHAGIQSTLYTIRHKFWLLDGKNQVRKIVRNCVRCIRFRARPVQYKMADLPEPRVEEAVPFFHTGTDFFGPLLAKEKKHRNRSSIKVYGCVFICMSTKTVHFEIVGDLTTDSFLAAFKRFIGRRGSLLICIPIKVLIM